MKHLLESHPEIIAWLPNHFTESLAASAIYSTVLKEEFRTIVKIPIYEKLAYPLFNIVSVPVVVCRSGAVREPHHLSLHQSGLFAWLLSEANDQWFPIREDGED